MHPLPLVLFAALVHAAERSQSDAANLRSGHHAEIDAQSGAPPMELETPNTHHVVIEIRQHGGEGAAMGVQGTSMHQQIDHDNEAEVYAKAKFDNAMQNLLSASLNITEKLHWMKELYSSANALHEKMANLVHDEDANAIVWANDVKTDMPDYEALFRKMLDCRLKMSAATVKYVDAIGNATVKMRQAEADPSLADIADTAENYKIQMKSELDHLKTSECTESLVQEFQTIDEDLNDKTHNLITTMRELRRADIFDFEAYVKLFNNGEEKALLPWEQNEADSGPHTTPTPLSTADPLNLANQSLMQANGTSVQQLLEQQKALSIVQKLLAQQDAERNATAAGAKIAELERAKAAAVAAEDYRRAAELKEEIALAASKTQRKATASPTHLSAQPGAKSGAPRSARKS